MSTKLFVGGLSHDTNDASLHAAFAPFGDIVEARVIFDRETGRSKGYGFVRYRTPESAQSAMERMAGSSVDGRSIRVDIAEDRRPGGPGRGFDGPPRSGDGPATYNRRPPGRPGEGGPRGGWDARGEGPRPEGPRFDRGGDGPRFDRGGDGPRFDRGGDGPRGERGDGPRFGGGPRPGYDRPPGDRRFDGPRPEGPPGRFANPRPDGGFRDGPRGEGFRGDRPPPGRGFEGRPDGPRPPRPDGAGRMGGGERPGGPRPPGAGPRPPFRPGGGGGPGGGFGGGFQDEPEAWDDGRIRRRAEPDRKKKDREGPAVDGARAVRVDREKRTSGKNWRSYTLGEEPGDGEE